MKFQPRLITAFGGVDESAKALLVVAFIIQAVFFTAAVYLSRGHWLYSDNTFYETPAWNLASGHGLSIARSEWEDPYLTNLYYAAHREAAVGAYIPAVVFPPGYCYFLSAVYVVAGRSHLVAVLANGFLLLATLVAILVLVRRSFGQSLEANLALSLTAIFPMWAFWASKIMSDTLHVFLITLFAVVWFVDKPSVRRTVVAGIILGLASLTRPYAVLLPFAFGIAWVFFRLRTFSLRNVMILALVTWALVGTWTMRNYYYFEKSIIVTSMGAGYGLWVASYESTEGLGKNFELDLYREIGVLGIQDIHRVEDNTRLRTIALQRILEHPGQYALARLWHMPRSWISLGSDTPWLIKSVLGTYFSLLLVAMVAGMITLRRTPNVVLAGSIVIVVYYTLVFMPLHTEARYTLPARAFGFLLCATALAALLRWLPIKPVNSSSTVAFVSSNGRISS